MAGFRDIVGHQQIISHLKTAIATDRVSHAYIFNGPDYSGKMMLAEAFAMALQCETIGGDLHDDEPEQMTLFDIPGVEGSSVSSEAEARAKDMEPCLECHSCRQALGKNQPDIRYVTRKKTVISVDDVRIQINHDVVIKPYSSRYKIYIMDEAERMNVQAQNALLKTVEEPPSYVVMLLLTTNADSFLPTILSRCVRLDLKPIDDEMIRNHLMQKRGVPDYQADLCVAFAQGNLGRAIMLASSEQFVRIKEQTISLMGRLDRLTANDIVKDLGDITEKKENISVFLDLVLLFFRDVLLYKSTGSPEKLVFGEQEEMVARMAGKFSLAGLDGIIKAVDTAGRRVGMNVNAPLALEILLLEIKENMR